ncbi:hypothetical protein RP20_CCG027590 [Aedes albopictus]|nr:hypothetical protein RP20_CCG027590 [Aedes albopictus]
MAPQRKRKASRQAKKSAKKARTQELNETTGVPTANTVQKSDSVVYVGCYQLRSTTVDGNAVETSVNKAVPEKPPLESTGHEPSFPQESTILLGLENDSSLAEVGTNVTSIVNVEELSVSEEVIPIECTSNVDALEALIPTTYEVLSRKSSKGSLASDTNLKDSTTVTALETAAAGVGQPSEDFPQASCLAASQADWETEEGSSRSPECWEVDNSLNLERVNFGTLATELRRSNNDEVQPSSEGTWYGSCNSSVRSFGSCNEDPL